MPNIRWKKRPSQKIHFARELTNSILPHLIIIEVELPGIQTGKTCFTLVQHINTGGNEKISSTV